MKKENLERGKIILKNIEILKDFEIILNDQYTFVSIMRPGKTNISLELFGVLLKNIDFKKYQNEIINELKNNLIKQIENFEIEFENSFLIFLTD